MEIHRPALCCFYGIIKKLLQSLVFKVSVPPSKLIANNVLIFLIQLLIQFIAAIQICTVNIGGFFIPESTSFWASSATIELSIVAPITVDVGETF